MCLGFLGFLGIWFILGILDIGDVRICLKCAFTFPRNGVTILRVLGLTVCLVRLLFVGFSVVRLLHEWLKLI